MKKKIMVTSLVICAFIGFIALGFNFMSKSYPILDGSADWLKITKITHRGLFNNDKEIPENSLAAFKKSIENNFTIELDVQLTKDNEVVVFHDYNLERMTGTNKDLSDMNYIDILDLKLIGTNEYIPTLQEVLDLVNGEVPILIEIKNEGKVGNLEAQVYRQIKNYNGDLAIQSFNPFVLSWFKDNAKDVIRGQLAGSLDDTDNPQYQKFILENLLMNFESKPAFIAYEIKELPKWIVNQQRKNGTPIIGWTVKSKDDLNDALDNCDNIIFEEF